MYAQVPTKKGNVFPDGMQRKLHTLAKTYEQELKPKFCFYSLGMVFFYYYSITRNQFLWQITLGWW